MPRAQLTAVAGLILLSIQTAANAGDTLEIQKGRLSDDGSYGKQVVAVTNRSASVMSYVKVQCGFFRGSQLIAATFAIVENIQPGQTAYEERAGMLEDDRTVAVEVSH